MTISELSFENNSNTNILSKVAFYPENVTEFGEYDEGPYFTITPTVWILTMLTGAGMWAVFFYAMHIILNFIF